MVEGLKCGACGKIVPRLCSNCWSCSSCCKCDPKTRKWMNGNVGGKMKKQ